MGDADREEPVIITHTSLVIACEKLGNFYKYSLNFLFVKSEWKATILCICLFESNRGMFHNIVVFWRLINASMVWMCRIMSC